ncbi:MAG: hypothetical protein P8J20_10425 [Novosphingobium sp.]|nr:hypothetical protein [Novosphingobium sp.]
MTSTTPARIDIFTGDSTGLAIPAHPDALRASGEDFLTQAFRAFGSLGEDNAVSCITRLEHCPGGSTGEKLFLTVEYAQPDPALHTELFVKFSRDFADERRDLQGRFEMRSEVPFAWMARNADFPIAVPRPLFADYREECGSGLIVTERIAYGEGRIEPHRRKCLDRETLDDPLSTYRAVVTTLAKLCAAHKAGRLSSDVDARFPFDPASGTADPIRYDDEALQAELDTCFAFARSNPRLLPDELRSDEFLRRMQRDSFLIKANEPALQRFLKGNPDMIALCHWNAHIDNCFFWSPENSGEAGERQCGFIDWGRVGQLTFGSVLWGGLSAAHHTIWEDHLDELLALFVSVYAEHGGPVITAEALEQHLMVHMATMGVARVLAFPEVITFRCPDIEQATGVLDPRIQSIDPARNSLHIYTMYLKTWHARDFGVRVERVLAAN